MNGCHSQITPNRLQHDLIYHSKGKVSWANVMTRECQYIKQENIVDDGCDGCREKEKTILLIRLVEANSTDTKGNGDMNIYLAGGMKSNWQDLFINKFPEHIFIDPRTHGLKDEKEYTAWDLNGIYNSDVVISYMDTSNPSGYGLCLEVGYAKALNKRIIYICEDESDRQRYFGMVRSCADEVYTNINEAFQCLTRI